ncbi:hypothetical protein [Rhizobium sullae]|uniref:hypothetical protein n=1 Tax=Rhizobium sullae TaxID=50338 RepID=UPI001A9E599E|nr:hypothetical protein [Rhizobium sullae]
MGQLKVPKLPNRSFSFSAGRKFVHLCKRAVQHFQAAFFHLALPTLPGKFMDAPDFAKPGLIYSLKINAHNNCLSIALIAFFFGARWRDICQFCDNRNEWQPCASGTAEAAVETACRQS